MMSEVKPTVEQLLAKAKKPSEDAMRLHPYYHGKLQVAPKCRIRDFQDFAIWYTPGVAAPCRDIAANPENVYLHTNKGNFVAVVSDGTRVLGLGNIGPYAGMPVMEGKGILFKYLGGVDAFPICLNTSDPDEIIQAVKWMEPCFGGINLEDIEKPKCFYILERLRAEMPIPVWHDDQQGTAAITLAGLINALKVVGKSVNEARITMVGAGAANIATYRMMRVYGFPAENIIMVDSHGILNPQRTDLDNPNDKIKWQMCHETNRERRSGGIADALRGADACIGLSRSGPGVILPEWIRGMAEEAIVFACANPVPEIWPWEAKEAGARVVATGRSDFPNQVNNSLGFPGIFRGALDVRARTITDEMCIAAAVELARCAEDHGLTPDYIIPNMDEWEVYPREAAAVGMKAIEQGIAQVTATREELFKKAEDIIRNAREQAGALMSCGNISMAEGVCE